MSSRLVSLLFALGVLTGAIISGLADSYPLANGTTLEGEPIAFAKDGLAVKKSDGSFSEKVAWTNFTQAALKKLAALPKAQPFVEPYLEPDDPEALKRPSEIALKPVSRLPRPEPHGGWGGMFHSSLALTMLFIVYLGNIYAGYEIAMFRSYPPGLVCGLSAVAPVIVPIVFLSLPTRLPPTPAELAREEDEEEELLVPGEAATQPEAVSAEGYPVHSTAPATATASAPRLPAPIIYQRGQTTFNRRFFETKLSGFLRIVPSDAEKDMLVHIRSTRGHHAGQRISKVMPNELSLQIRKGDASSDVSIPYSEIQEVQIRHKDT